MTIFKKHLYILFLGLLLLPDYVNAQSDFRPGYIISNNLDTVYGFVDYRGMKLNAQRCVFKKDKKSEPIKYNPLELYGYRFTDSKYYISYQDSTYEQGIFLEYLIQGTIDVFFYKEDIEHYFVRSEEGRLVELEREDEITTVDGIDYFKKAFRYKGVLIAIMDDCPELKPRIESAQLSHNSLIDLAKNYHELTCESEKCIIYEKEKFISKFNWGIQINMSTSSLLPYSSHLDSEEEYLDAEYVPSNNLGLGILLNLSFPSISDNLSMNMDIDYSSGKIRGYSQILRGVTDIHHSDLYYTYNAISSKLGLMYVFPTKLIRPKIYGGVLVSFPFMQKFSRIVEVESDAVVFTNSKDYPIITANTQLGIFGGIGIETDIWNGKKLFLKVSYNIHDGLYRDSGSSLNLGLEVISSSVGIML